MSEFKIGAIVNTPPQKKMAHKGYGPIYEQVGRLAGGESLPVEFKEPKAALNLYQTSRARLRNTSIVVALRNTTVWFTKEEPK